MEGKVSIESINYANDSIQSIDLKIEMVNISDQILLIYNDTSRYHYGVTTRKSPVNETIGCIDPLNEKDKETIGFFYIIDDGKNSIEYDRYYKNYPESYGYALQNIDFGPPADLSESKMFKLFNIDSIYYPTDIHYRHNIWRGISRYFHLFSILPWQKYECKYRIDLGPCHRSLKPGITYFIRFSYGDENIARDIEELFNKKFSNYFFNNTYLFNPVSFSILPTKP
jgi:hypothetical protein